jgi:protein SCO1/2
MKRAILVLAALCLWAGSVWGAKRYDVTGILLKVDRPHKTFVASCAAIPGFMEAMVMPYSVRDEKALDGVQPGMQIEFTLVVDTDHSYVEGIKAHRFESMAQDPMRARRLQILDGSDANPAPLAIGQPAPDFHLIDQVRKPVTLSQFTGKVVALTFIYTTCPLPDFCFRLSNNFGKVAQRFAGRMGRDLVLLSITFDPVHDEPEVLAKYAATWKADPKSWHFLTGPLPAVKALCRSFGVNFWQDEGLLTHTLHTVVIDRRGRVAANLEGNEFTADQLGDLVKATLDRVQ